MDYKYPRVQLKTVGGFCISILLYLLIYTPVAAQNEVSVDQFTGTANVAIPLTAVGIKDAGVSINLVYNASRWFPPAPPFTCCIHQSGVQCKGRKGQRPE
jgi:hypothetical protein